MQAVPTSLRNPTVVVGGGLAGLAAACYLARGGRSVTVLEKAPALGGRADTDTRDGFALNRGVHAFYSGGPASEVLADLGVRYTSGVPNRLFASDARGVHLFPATPLALLRTSLLSAGDKRELLGILVRIGMLRPQSLASVSLADWIDQTAHRPRVRQLLESLARVSVYSAALDLASADAFVEKIQQSFKHPVQYIDAGWQTLVDGLRAAATSLGVDIRTSASVAAVEMHAGRATAMRLHDGSQLAAADVVLAVTPDEAVRLLGNSADSLIQLQRVVAQSVPVHVACLDLSLTSLPSSAYPVVFDLERPLFMTVQSAFAQLAPAGGAVIHAFKQLDPRQPSQPATDRADLEAFMDSFQPGWRDVTLERRFLPRMLAAGALPMATHGGLAGRIESRSQDAPNVYFAGDWVGPRGFQVDASLHSARQAARLILHDQALAAGAAPARRAA